MTESEKAVRRQYWLEYRKGDVTYAALGAKHEMTVGMMYARCQWAAREECKRRRERHQVERIERLIGRDND